MKLSNRLAAFALVALALFGGLATQATPAAAATQVTACFRWSTGIAYAGQPVVLQGVRNGSWANIRQGVTRADGCRTFSNVPSDRRVKVVAHRVFGDTNIGLAIFQGASPRTATSGRGSANLGTGYVYLVQCIPGLYDRCAGF
jgi:hypothetical protein